MIDTGSATATKIRATGVDTKQLAFDLAGTTLCQTGRETFPVFHGDAMCKFLGPSPEVGPGDMYFSYRPNPLQGPGVPQPMRRAHTLTS
jgi:hypothetical protein